MALASFHLAGFRTKARLLQHSLLSLDLPPASPDRPRGVCTVGAVELVASVPERIAYFADVVVAFAPVQLSVESLRGGSVHCAPFAHRVLALASPSGHLGLGTFLFVPPKGSPPSVSDSELVAAARRGSIAPGVLRKPWLSLRDFACQFGMLCSMLSTPYANLISILPSGEEGAAA